MPPKGYKYPPGKIKRQPPKHHKPGLVGRPAGLNRMQERFAHEYLVDMNPAAAYLRAGYTPTTDESAVVCASRLLRNLRVAELVEKLQRETLSRTDINRDDTISRFKIVYLSAMAERDYSNALRALENIGRYLGLYEKDNTQKKYTESDIDKLRTELEAAGFNFEIAAYKSKQLPPLDPEPVKRVEVVSSPTVLNGDVHVPPASQGHNGTIPEGH